MTKIILLSCILALVVLLLVLGVFIFLYLLRIGRYIEKGAAPRPGEPDTTKDKSDKKA